MKKDDLERVIKGTPIQSIYAFDTITSTNDFGLAQLHEGADAPDWTLIVADKQTAGRGRLNRRWVTEAGAGLAFSLILRLTDNEAEHVNLFSPIGALAVSEALEAGYGLQPAIKWPNDVLLGGKKTSGILAETSWLGEVMRGLVIGIGINITPAAIPPPEMLMFPATCVESETGHAVDRLDLLHMIIASLAEWRKQLATPEFYGAWEGRLAFRGEAVRVERPAGDPLIGIVLGISANGDLRLMLDKGGEVHISVGDVRLRPVVEFK